MNAADSTQRSGKILCVDLDGTLLATDTLWETILALLRQNPLFILLLPYWVMRGKVCLKRQIAQRVVLDVAQLPVHSDVIEYLRQEHREGRTLVLATATDRSIADRIAGHIGLFSEVLATDGRKNLSGSAKGRALVERYGERGFVYMGNSAVDLPIWRHADEAILVHPSSRLLKEARRVVNVGHVFHRERNGRLVSILKAIRIHQWIKNLLLFVPLITAHKVANLSLLGDAGLAFIAFSFCASGVYVLNDLLDLEVDRAHPTKRNRPFASGKLGIPTGILLAGLLTLSGFSIALMLPRRFFAILGLYVGMTTAYSVYLKRIVTLDVIALAGLYTLRIFAGGEAVRVTISAWLLAFSMFLFLSLALLKRCSELSLLRGYDKGHVEGRGYREADLASLTNLGAASGYISVLVLALYINSSQVTGLYTHPEVLWLTCPLLLYWVSRIWLKAGRGEVHDDPVIFALQDKVSYAVGAAVALLMMLAI
jgi:4-hydroxybenzoate polyprenyltransferase